MAKNNNTVFDCSIIHFPKIHNRAGNITPIQNNIEVPFEIKRVYYLYDVPGGETRGAHGHKALEQVIVAVSGSFDVMIDDGVNKKILLRLMNTRGIFPTCDLLRAPPIVSICSMPFAPFL